MIRLKSRRVVSSGLHRGSPLAVSKAVAADKVVATSKAVEANKAVAQAAATEAATAETSGVHQLKQTRFAGKATNLMRTAPRKQPVPSVGGTPPITPRFIN